jgi:predicted metal-binding membrane protein
MVAARIRGMARPHWMALYGAIIAAWATLYIMALPADLRAAGAIYGADFLRSLCVVSPDAAGYAGLVVMWLLMSAAMMAPTALPAFATYDELGSRAETRFGALVAGYLAVWGGFSVLAAAAQMALTQARALTVFGDSRSAALSGALLILAGLYQFSALKEACLSKCRAPLAFFMQHWGEGPFRNGLRLGAVCLGCCWALMLLAFVGGVMNIAFMGLATLVMALEKLTWIGAVITRPLGGLLIAGGILTLAAAIV